MSVANTPGSADNQDGKFTFSDSRTGSDTTIVGVANAAEGIFDQYGKIGQRSYTLYRAWMCEGFLQDQWRVTSKLVIEAGARYRWYNPYRALWGNQSMFNKTYYNAADAVTVDPKNDVVTGGDPSNGVVIPGGGSPSNAQGHVDPAILNDPVYKALFRGLPVQYSPTVKTNIQPRFGITYLVRPRTVIRGGGERYIQRLGITGNVFTGDNAPHRRQKRFRQASDNTLRLTLVRNPGIALKFGAAPASVTATSSQPVALTYDLATATAEDTPTPAGGFDGKGDAYPVEMLPQHLSFQCVDFNLAGAATATPNAVVARGQAIKLPCGDGNRVYVLAASNEGDQAAEFRVGSQIQKATIEDWGGFSASGSP